MGKFNDLKTLEPTTARVTHHCYNCGKLIFPGEKYYSEKLKDKFLNSLHMKKFCSDCYEKNGEELLKMGKDKKRKESKKREKIGSLNEFFKGKDQTPNS